MPNLYNDDLEKDRADFFVKLLKPSFNTKMEDFFHFFRLPVEPQDWSVQTAYSLANLRAGNLSTARKENKKLIKKGSKFADCKKRKKKKKKRFKICQGERKQNVFGQRLEINLQLHLPFKISLQSCLRALIEAHGLKEQEAKKVLAKALEMNSSRRTRPK